MMSLWGYAFNGQDSEWWIVSNPAVEAFYVVRKCLIYMLNMKVVASLISFQKDTKLFYFLQVLIHDTWFKEALCYHYVF